MKRILTAAILAATTLSARVEARAALHDPVALNIGVNCQWQTRCMAQQRSAMKRALRYVVHRRPPEWRVQLCNRNARRRGNRVDWIGFDHCIRNTTLRPPTQRSSMKKR